VGTSSSGCVAYNNLWYDCVRTAHYNFSLSHSWYDTGMNRDGDNTSVQLGTADPLINWADGDFHLKAATNAGHTLAAPFNQDMYGNTRGADGTWDRGAIEFTATNIGIFDFQLPNADCPTLPNPIMLMGINGLKLMTDNLRFYNIAGGRVPVSRLDQAGLYLAADAGIIHKLVLVK
jgi:hypothetical protein